MTIRYSWLWNGASILFFISFGIGAILGFADGAFLQAAIFAFCVLLAAYLIAMSPVSGQLDETKMTMHMLWGGTFQMNWAEVTEVKTNSAQFAFLGHDKWFSVTLLAALDRKQVTENIQKEIAERKIAVSRLKFSAGASFWLFKNTRIRS